MPIRLGSFRVWSGHRQWALSANAHYSTMSMEDLARLPVMDLAATDCVLFMWACWPSLPEALGIVEAWGFTYKTCAFRLA
jgi:N6-adenosine-specific RNA methylase IME4